MLDGVGHDEFFYREFVDQFLELLVGAQAMEPKAIDVPCSFVFEVDRLLSDGLASSDHIGKENHVSSFHLLA